VIKSEEIRAVFISRTDNIGDVILTLPLVFEARFMFKEAAINFYVNEKIEPLLDGIGININVVHESSGQSLAEKKEYLRELRTDLAIFAKPEFDLALIFYLLKTRYRAGTAYRWFSFLYNLRVKEHRKYADKHESVYNLNLLRELTGTKSSFKLPERLLGYSESESSQLENKLEQLGLKKQDKFLIIHPGSRGSAKDITLEQLREIGSKLLAEYPGFKIVYTGLKEEKEKVLSSIPADFSDRTPDLSGKLSLRELMILIDKSELFISNSTGPAHIAGALNKNVIGFYPNSPPMNDIRWRPLGNNTTIIKPVDGSDEMRLIKPDDVIASAGKYLKQ